MSIDTSKIPTKPVMQNATVYVLEDVNATCMLAVSVDGCLFFASPGERAVLPMSIDHIREFCTSQKGTQEVYEIILRQISKISDETPEENQVS